jgi:dihydroxyacetone kinase-like protein
MNGAAITVLKLDEESKKLLDVPAICAAFQFI